MDKSLSKFAEELGIPYHKVWRDFTRGKLENAYKDNEGKIYIRDTIAATTQSPQEVKINPFHDDYNKNTNPIGVVYDEEDYRIAKAGSKRVNEAINLRATERFANIQNTVVPFRYAGGGYGSTDISPRDAIILCQHMFWSFPAFQNTIRLLVEFAVGDLFFKSKNKKARDFFAAYFDRLNLRSLQEKFYLEYWRSGNVFIWPILGQIKDDEFIKLVKQFGANVGGNKQIPLRYQILNPADIIAEGSVSFTIPKYKKLLSDYELERLRNPRTPEDQEILEALDPKIKQEIKKSKKTNNQFYIDLPKESILAVFNLRQDYESFAVPFGFCILEAVNFRREMQNLDRALMRTIQQAILHFKVGAELKNGQVHLKQGQIKQLEEIFKNGSVARVLITDFSVDGKFIIPDINNLLDARRYEDVNFEIQQGLRNIFLVGGGGDKFANQITKVELFIQGINYAREVFKREFLYPEIERIKKNLGMKGKIIAEYEEIDLKNELEYSKLFVRMAELGFLTSEELNVAIEKGILPAPEDSEESQKHFKSLKEKKLYEPLLNKKQEEDKKPNGRPSGTKAPQSTKKISPIGTKASFMKFSGVKIVDTMEKYNTLKASVTEEIKKINKLKKLNKNQEEIAKQISDLILFNEEKDQWSDKDIIASYIKNPTDKNTEKIQEINEISSEHNLDLELAAFLRHSQV